MTEKSTEQGSVLDPDRWFRQGGAAGLKIEIVETYVFFKEHRRKTRDGECKCLPPYLGSAPGGEGGC